MSQRTCSVEGCERLHVARSMCGMHYQRWRVPTPTASDRFWRKVAKSEDGCWVWNGAKSAGYGRFAVGRRWHGAHRFAYELTFGPIPPGLVIDHLCRNALCVNPAHMEPVTTRENTMRGNSPGAIIRRGSHCAKGHEYTPENTRCFAGGRRRTCRECARIWHAMDLS